MKSGKKLIAVALLLTLVFVLASCSTFGGIKKNFIDAGYTYVESKDDSEDDAKTASLVVAELEEGDITCTIHVFKKQSGEILGIGINKYAFVLEFSSEKAVQKAFAEDGSATLKGLIKDAQNSKYVNGNCILIPSILDNDEKTEIFNK